MDKAIELYMDSLKQEPFIDDTLTNLAIAHIKVQNWSQAEEFCNRCLYLYPANVKALCRRAIARKELGHFEESKKDWEKVRVVCAVALHYISADIKAALLRQWK